MKTLSLFRLMPHALLATALFAVPALAQTPTLTSTFDTNGEGWEVIGMSLYSHTPAYAGSPATYSTAGHPGGCLEVFDDFYFTGISAPASWLGNKRAYFGGTLSFDLYEWETTSSWVQPGAELVPTNHTLFYAMPVPTPSQWVSQSCAITPGAWRFDDSLGPVATQSQMLEVLADLQAVWVATEWRSGIDDTFIDNIRLAPPVHGSVAIFGSGINPAGSLSLLSGNAQLGTTLTLGIDNPLGTQAPGSLPFLAVSIAPMPPFPSGATLPGLGMSSSSAPGQLMVNVDPALLVTPLMMGAPWTGPGNPVPMTLNLPLDPALSGLTLYAQGAMVDLGPGGWLALTDAAMLNLGT